MARTTTTTKATKATTKATKATKATTTQVAAPATTTQPATPATPVTPVVAATVPALALQALLPNPAKPGTKRHAWLACVLASKATTQLAATWQAMQAAGNVPQGCGAPTMHHVNWAVRAKLVRTAPLGK